VILTDCIFNNLKAVGMIYESSFTFYSFYCSFRIG